MYFALIILNLYQLFIRKSNSYPMMTLKIVPFGFIYQFYFISIITYSNETVLN